MRVLVLLAVAGWCSMTMMGVGNAAELKATNVAPRAAAAKPSASQAGPLHPGAPGLRPQGGPVPGIGPARPFVQPGIQPRFAGIWPQGRPMITGRRGWHPVRNASIFVLIPGAMVGGLADLESFVDALDLSAPVEPVTECPVPCSAYGALSIANDGAWGSSWNYPDAQGATAQAVQNCATRTSTSCNTTVIGGTSWIAALYCDNGLTHSGVMMPGNDAQSAVANAFRYVTQNSMFSINDCAVVSLVAGDGSQTEYQKGQ